jgi:hypothetical protein
VCAAHFAYVCSGLLPFSSPAGTATDTGAYGLLGLDFSYSRSHRKAGTNAQSLPLTHSTRLCASRSIIAFRMTEVMEWATCREGDNKEVKEGEVPSTSLKRSLGGLFGLIGTTDTTSTSISPPSGVNAQSPSALRSFQMRTALSPIKVQWALLLADLGMLKSASAYARDAKYVADGALIALARQSSMQQNNNHNGGGNAHGHPKQGKQCRNKAG